MSKLRFELDRFWNFYNLTPEEYNSGIVPTINNEIGFSEWESRYPFWKDLEGAFKVDLDTYNATLNKNLLENMFELIAIDNESGLVLDYISNHIVNLEEFIKLGLDYYLINTKIELMTFLEAYTINNVAPILIKILEKEKNLTLIRFTLNTLFLYSKDEALKFSFLHYKSPDEYLRLSCFEIISKTMRNDIPNDIMNFF